MDPVRIFYSWQSDRGRDECGRFIEIALQVAIESLQPRVTAQLQLDSDTAGVAGTPPVTETILAKIRACDIFVGDVSFVGVTPGGKLLPNPNVMTEFGYARSVLEHEQILLVMNTAFGPETALPFDLAYLRFPTAYSLEEGASAGTRRTTRARFADKLTPHLEATIRAVMARRDTQAVEKDTLQAAHALVATLDQLTSRGDVPVIVSGPKLILRLAPIRAASEPFLDPAIIKAARPKLIPNDYTRSMDQVDVRQWASFDPPRRVADKPNPEARWYSRIIRPGVLEAAITVGERIDDDRTVIVEGRPVEGRIVETAKRFADFITDIGLDGPLVISARLDGAEDVQLMMSHRVSRPYGMPGIVLGSVGLHSASAVTAGALRPLFDTLWLGFGFEDGSPSFHGEAWEGDVVPALYAPPVIGRRTWGL